jgi:hypothetical protein
MMKRIIDAILLHPYDGLNGANGEGGFHTLDF